MKRFLLYCMAFVFCLKGWAQDDFVAKTIQIFPSSTLSIKDDTNITEFGCDFNTFYLEKCTTVAYKRNGNDISFKNAVLSLKNKGFDCGYKAINKDFHSLLKTEDYPKITLELTHLTFYKENSGQAYVKIVIAGKEQEYSFPVEICCTPLKRFVGKLKLDIREFNLEPPKKMFGLIVIKDEIEIDFDLVVRL